MSQFFTQPVLYSCTGMQIVVFMVVRIESYSYSLKKKIGGYKSMLRLDSTLLMKNAAIHWQWIEWTEWT